MPLKGKHLVIVGGGTAGWMAAHLLLQSWQSLGLRITLIESPDIGIIGVGEGSTPQLKQFFDKIGIAESEWMPICNATYKTGIAFEGWSRKPGFERYFHPFPAQTDAFTAPGFVLNCNLRRFGSEVPANPESFFLNAWLASHKLGPHATENFPLYVNYGYHFDAGLLGQFLAAKAIASGVKHINAKVVGVEQADNGDISALNLDTGETVSSDIVVDCSGFASVLMQKVLAVPFVSFSKNLFNDNAVTLATPISHDFSPQTVSTAMTAGWAWDIPLRNRRGNGYVYSSSYCSADEAETELRKKLGMLESDTAARHLKMKVGRVERHWHHNCLAVGLSQGFIEPLEATALHLVQETVRSFIEEYERGSFSSRYRDPFNAKITARFEGVRDYIVAHYRVNSRGDSPYWQDNARNDHLSDSLRSIFHAWMNGGDIIAELERQDISCYYSNLSWLCLLAGYGVFPAQERLAAAHSVSGACNVADVQQFIRRCALNFSSHADQLQHL